MSEEITGSVGTAVLLADELPEMEVGSEQQDEVAVPKAAEVQAAPVEVAAAVPETVLDEVPTLAQWPEADQEQEDEIFGMDHNVITERESFTESGSDDWEDEPITSFTSALEDVVVMNADRAAEFRNEANQEPMMVYSPRGIGADAIRRMNSKWENSLTKGKHRIGMGSPRIDNPSNILRGNIAQTILRRVANLGANVVVFLPRSCIYLELAPPGDDEVIATDYSYITERSRLGISTNGMLLAATSGTFVENTVKLALRCVVNTNVANLGNDTVTALMERIDPLDYPLIVNAMMTARYANGYPWTMRCINSNCNHEHEGRMNFARCQRIDFSMLTDEQLVMAATKNRTITDAELKSYRDKFKLSDLSKFNYNDNISIELTTGSLLGYVDSARAWKSTIEASQTRALASYATDAERNRFLNSQIQIHFMRKFAHFVERIVINAGTDKEQIIEDYADIVDSLTTLSKNVVLATEFENHVLSWLEANTISVVGYPAWECTSCKTVQSKTKEGPFRNFVPIAIDRVFFLVSRRLSEKLAVLTANQSEI